MSNLTQLEDKLCSIRWRWCGCGCGTFTPDDANSAIAFKELFAMSLEMNVALPRPILKHNIFEDSDE